MRIEERMEENIKVQEAPTIPGLTFRRFRGEADYAPMAALIAQCKGVDGIERSTSVDDIARNYRHLENCDPQTDMLFAEVDGQVIAYGRVWWEEMSDGSEIFIIFGQLHPDWRGRGLGAAMWAAGEERCRIIAAGHPKEVIKSFHVEVFETEKARISMLEKCGYRRTRYEVHMVRDLSEPFPEAPMPEELEVRPVRPEDIRPIFDGSNEAFRDHWGARDESEEEYKLQQEQPIFRPELWKVAWDGDQMAGAVHNFIDEKENEEYKRMRGYTEGICTRRPWRKRGLARSLLVQSMQMFKNMGMAETALSADAENISGATRLYESVGYRKVRQQIIFRKPLE